MYSQDSGNDTFEGNSSNEDSNAVSNKIAYETVADVANTGTLNACMRRKYGWKQLRLQIIVIRKFKEVLPRFNDKACSSFTYDKNIYPNSKFDEFSVKLSKDQCPTGIKQDIKSIEVDTTADTSIKSELTFKSDETEAVSSNVKGYVSGEWNQIRLRASGTNIFNEIKENVSVTTESKEQFSCSKEVKLSNVRFQNNKFMLQIKNI